MNREDLEMMTKLELMEHAQVQGLKLDSIEKKGTMIDKILGEHKEEAKPQVAKRVESALPALGRLHTLDGKPVDAKKYRVTIFATETDKNDVDIICNGHNVRVKRGVEVILLEPYVEILRNAVIETVSQDPDSGVRSAQRMMVYPHSAIPL
jgi:hypothetical protein